jgi:hypothetical protein
LLARGGGRDAIDECESCRVDEILEVTRVEPKRIEGPTFERGLQDEDVATVLDESYDPPR